MVDFGPPHGFALRRRGSCLENESGNVTWDEFSRCCPKPSIDESGACCPTANNCMEDIKNPAHCADESWLLFRNTKDNGYFCCLPGTDGFLTIFNDNKTGVGCQDSTDPQTSDYLWQPRVITGKIHILLTWYEPTSDITRRRWFNLPFKLGRYSRWRSWWCCWVSNHSCLALVFHASPITEATPSRGNAHYRSTGGTIWSCYVFRQTERVGLSRLYGRAGEYSCPRVARKYKDPMKSYGLHFNLI